MPTSRSFNTSESGRVARTSMRQHRAWNFVSSTIRRLFSQDGPRNVHRQHVERPPALEDEPLAPSSDIPPTALVQANAVPQPPAPQQPVLPPPPTLPATLPLAVFHRASGERRGSGAGALSSGPSNVATEQVAPVPAPSSSGTPRRPAPLQRQGAFHELYRPYWAAGSGYEPPVVYGRSPATLPENQVWNPLWGPVPHLSVITALSHGPPTPQQVLNYLNIRFRHNRRAYYMALDILFPQTPGAPVEPRIPVFQRVLQTSQWRREHPDWEGGIVPVDREVGPVYADDAADSQAGSDDEDNNDGVLTTRELHIIRTRVARLLPDAYRAHLAGEQAPGASSGPASSSSASPSRSSSIESSEHGSSSSTSSTSGSASSSSSATSSDSSFASSSGSSSPDPSSPSSRKRRHEENEERDAQSDCTLHEEHSTDRPSTRRRLDSESDTPSRPASPGSSSTSTTHRRHGSRAQQDGRRQERRELMRQNRSLLPPIGPPGVRISGPEPASTSQSRVSVSNVVDHSPRRVADAPALPVGGSSRSSRNREAHDEGPPLKRSPKRSRDEDVSETSTSQRDDRDRDEEDRLKKKKRSRE